MSWFESTVYTTRKCYFFYIILLTHQSLFSVFWLFGCFFKRHKIWQKRKLYFVPLIKTKGFRGWRGYWCCPSWCHHPHWLCFSHQALYQLMTTAYQFWSLLLSLLDLLTATQCCYKRRPSGLSDWLVAHCCISACQPTGSLQTSHPAALLLLSLPASPWTDSTLTTASDLKWACGSSVHPHTWCDLS